MMQQNVVETHKLADSMVISAVMPQHIDVVWNDVSLFINRACKRSNGRHNLHTVYTQLKNGSQHLWIVIKPDTEQITACATTQMVTYATGLKMLEVVLLGGSHKDDWIKDGWKILEKWAKQNECDGIQAIGRKGLRFLTVKEDDQWKEQAVMFEKVFKEKK